MWDSQYVVKTWIPRSERSQRSPSTKRLLPIPGGPTSPAMRPLPFIDWSIIAAMVLSSQSRPTRVDNCRDRGPPARATSSRRRAITGDCAPLIRTLSGSLEHDALLNQPRSGFTEHHSAGRRDRLHPLRHADLLTDRGVTPRPRTHFAGDHLTGIQPDPQLQRQSRRARCTSRSGDRPHCGCPVRPGRRVMRDPPTQPERRTRPSSRRR